MVFTDTDNVGLRQILAVDIVDVDGGGCQHNKDAQFVNDGPDVDKFLFVRFPDADIEQVANLDE